MTLIVPQKAIANGKVIAKASHPAGFDVSWLKTLAIITAAKIDPA